MQEERWENQNVDMDPAVWQMDIAISLFWAIEQPSHTPTIGGRVQSIVVTKDGAREQSFSRVAEGGDPTNEADWETVTERLSDTKAYVRRSAAADVEGELGLVAAHIIER